MKSFVSKGFVFLILLSTLLVLALPANAGQNGPKEILVATTRQECAASFNYCIAVCNQRYKYDRQSRIKCHRVCNQGAAACMVGAK